MSIRGELAQNRNLHLEGNLYCQNTLLRPAPFEELYLQLRGKETRLYPDSAVKNLPEIADNHPLRSEWMIRKKSTELLARHLTDRRVKKILEVGAGNGWLCNRLAERTAAEICGIDINELELKQAANLFDPNRISFVLGNLWEPVLPKETFDAIVLASCIQYFPDLKLLIERLIELITVEGEIHIIDSPFYRSTQASIEATKRSRLYFQSMGCLPMTNHYFHHTFEPLKDFDFSMIYNPSTLFSRIQRKIIRRPVSPFPWMQIRRR